MLKSTQVLEVNNSSNQTGTVHHKDYKNDIENLKEMLRKALELEHKLDELSECLFEDGEFDREFRDAEERLRKIIHDDLSPMLGYLFINYESKKLEAV